MLFDHMIQVFLISLTHFLFYQLQKVKMWIKIWETRMANRNQFKIIKCSFCNDSKTLRDKFSGLIFKSLWSHVWWSRRPSAGKKTTGSAKALEHGAEECWERNVYCLKTVCVSFPRVPCVSSSAFRKLSFYSLSCIVSASWKFLLGSLASLLLPLSTFTLETLSWILSVPLFLWRCQVLVWLVHVLVEEDLTEAFCEQLSNSFAAATP